jgi:hypothetical protein
MTISSGSLGSSPTVPGARRLAATPQQAPASRLPISVVTLLASAGVFVASAAYTAGRLGYASSVWANRAYWFGQALVLVPIAMRLLGRRSLKSSAAITLVLVLTVAEYLLTVCYSPLGFTFTDEFLHWRGTVDLLQTGNPFTVNYGLPISAHYPGIEEVTAALVSCTGLSVFTAGLIVAGLAHLLFICTLYLAFKGITRDSRAAGIAVLVYFGTPALTSFDSMFVYETLALGFLGFTVLAAWKATTAGSWGERARAFALAILGIIATVVTHHVTSYMLTATLILVTVASVIAGSRRSTAILGALAFAATTAVVCWVIFVAPDTITYFRPTFDGVLQGLNALETGGSAHAPSTSASPAGDQLLEGIGILVTTALVILGCWRIWRRHRRQPWILAATIGSIGWFVALAVRVWTPDGQELSGRAAAFALVPVSLVAALAIIELLNTSLRRKWTSSAVAFVMAAVVMLLFDGLANGWPPYYERLPGPHQVAGFERSVGPQEIATADWSLWALGPGNRFAADFGTYPVLAGYGDQNPLQEVGYLYTSPKFTSAIARRARAQAVHYVLADQRLTQSLPASGAYFPGDTAVYTRPLPLADLTKFDYLPGVARVYDSGDIVIYNLQGPGYAP